MISKASFLLLSTFLICCGAEDQGTEGLQQDVKVYCLWNIMGDCHPLGTRCFKFVSEKRSWAESESHCVAMGGNLASVHSIDEYHFIQKLIRQQTGGTPQTWIGEYDATQGLWLWSDGSRFDYTNWFPGQPDHFVGVEHCMDMNIGGKLYEAKRKTRLMKKSCC